MKILLLSAYDATSHRVWREGLAGHLSHHEWTVLTLPPRFFAWRSRGNPLSWAFSRREILEQEYDLIVATSMTDMAGLKGIVPSLAAVPSIVYFHENQFAYPEQRERKEYQNYKLTNIYTALSADRVLFNSRYNMETFTEGVGGFLSLMPDHVPSGIIPAIREASVCLPVPLEQECFRTGKREGGPLRIVWNHRWEHDKAPERFFEALGLLRMRNVPCYLHVLGERFREIPRGFEKARERLEGSILTWGFVKNVDEYRRILASADLVVSTALHDFQGLAVLEAVAAGCVPVVPDRLAYPEFIPDQFRYTSFADNKNKEVEELTARLEKYCKDPERTRKIQAPDLKWLSWKRLGPKYEEIINSVSDSEV